MEHLKDVSLSEIERLRRAPGGQVLTSTPETEQHDHDLRWVRLDNGQVLAVILNTERNPRGYRDIAVLSRPTSGLLVLERKGPLSLL
jgi:hypothetical protein